MGTRGARWLVLVACAAAGGLPASATAFSLGPQNALSPTGSQAFPYSVAIAGGPPDRALVAWSNGATLAGAGRSFVRPVSGSGRAIGPAVDPFPDDVTVATPALAYEPANSRWLSVWPGSGPGEAEHACSAHALQAPPPTSCSVRDTELFAMTLSTSGRPVGPLVKLTSAAQGETQSRAVMPLGLERVAPHRFVLAYELRHNGIAEIRARALTSALSTTADRRVAGVAAGSAGFLGGALAFGTRGAGLVTWSEPRSTGRSSGLASFRSRISRAGVPIGKPKATGLSAFTASAVPGGFLLAGEANSRPFAPGVQFVRSKGRPGAFVKERSGAELGAVGVMGARRGLALFTKGPGDADDVFARVVDGRARFRGTAHRVSRMGGVSKSGAPGFAQVPAAAPTQHGRALLIAWIGHLANSSTPRRVFVRAVRP